MPPGSRCRDRYQGWTSLPSPYRLNDICQALFLDSFEYLDRAHLASLMPAVLRSFSAIQSRAEGRRARSGTVGARPGREVGANPKAFAPIARAVVPPPAPSAAAGRMVVHSGRFSRGRASCRFLQSVDLSLRSSMRHLVAPGLISPTSLLACRLVLLTLRAPPFPWRLAACARAGSVTAACGPSASRPQGPCHVTDRSVPPVRRRSRPPAPPAFFLMVYALWTRTDGGCWKRADQARGSTTSPEPGKLSQKVTERRFREALLRVRPGPPLIARTCRRLSFGVAAAPIPV